jgi:hypothetical protein
MQRIREQRQTIGNIRFLGQKHAGLTAAIALTAKEDSTSCHFFYGSNGILEARPVPSRTAGMRRSKTPRLTKRHVAAQYRQSLASKGFRQRDKKRHLRIPASTVGENQAIAGRRSRPVQKPAHRRIQVNRCELFYVATHHVPI